MFPYQQLVLIGFGAAQKAFVTMLINISPHFLKVPILIIEPKDINGSEVYQQLLRQAEVKHLKIALCKDNYRHLFKEHVVDQAIIVELAYRLDTMDLIKLCQQKRCLFINTSLDGWHHNDSALVKDGHDLVNKVDGQVTAVLNAGYNPGCVSSIVKRMLDILDPSKKRTHSEKAQHLGVTTIQISERDTQRTTLLSDENTLYNTWSVVGLIDEAMLPCRFSLGTHERTKPLGSTMVTKKPYQIELLTKCNHTRVRGYEPMGGDYVGTVIEHAESYSIAEYLRSPDGKYSPSVYYTYLINDTAKLACWYMDYCLDEKTHLPKHDHVLRADQILDGFDSCGVLLFCRKNQKLRLYWGGSILTNEDAKSYNSEINATVIQVGIHVLATVEWSIRNPDKGIIEPDYMDSNFITDFCRPYLGAFIMTEVTDKSQIKSDQFTDLLI